jgi:hypothetical protein
MLSQPNVVIDVMCQGRRCGAEELAEKKGKRCQGQLLGGYRAVKLSVTSFFLVVTASEFVIRAA